MVFGAGGSDSNLGFSRILEDFGGLVRDKTKQCLSPPPSRNFREESCEDGWILRVNTSKPRRRYYIALP